MSNIEPDLPGNEKNISDKKPHKSSYLFPTLLIIVTLVIVVIVVKKYRNPMQMPVHESGKEMTMASMGGQVGYVPVESTKVVTGSIDNIINYSGTVVPYTEQLIYPRVTGHIQEIPVYPGDEIKKGQLLVKLDSVELSSKVQESKFSTEAANHELTKAQREFEAAKARVSSHEHEIQSVQSDYDYWKEEIQREEKLYKNGAVSKDEYQAELNKFQSALANVDLHHDMHEESAEMMLAAQENVKKAQAMVDQSKAAQKTSEIVKDYTNITSPIHGYVSERLISPGVLVETGMPILKIVEMDMVRIQANIPTSALSGIRKGNPITIRSRKNLNLVKDAIITSIFPSADALSRTVVVESVIDNKDHDFLPGDFVSVDISGDHKEDVLMVPSSAIVRLDSQNTTAVWVIEESSTKDKPQVDTTKSESTNKDFYYTCVMHHQIHLDKPGNCPICGMKLVKKAIKKSLVSPAKPGTAHLKYVVVGIHDSNNTEIISGLVEGESVVSTGYDSLQENDKVYPTPWNSTGPGELPPPPEMKDMPGMSHSQPNKDKDSMGNMPGMKH